MYQTAGGLQLGVEARDKKMGNRQKYHPDGWNYCVNLGSKKELRDFFRGLSATNSPAELVHANPRLLQDPVQRADLQLTVERQ